MSLQMAAILQTKFSKSFPQMKITIFCSKFHWRFYTRVQEQQSNIGSDNGLAPNKQQAIVCVNDGLV